MLIPKGILALRKLAGSPMHPIFNFDGIRLERMPDGQARATCTDGKTMAQVTWNDEKMEGEGMRDAFGISLAHAPNFQATIPTSALDQAEKAMPRVTRENRFTAPTLLAVEEDTDSRTDVIAARLAGQDDPKTVRLVTTRDGVSSEILAEVEKERFPTRETIEANDVTPKAGTGLKLTVNFTLLKNLVDALVETQKALDFSHASSRGSDTLITLELHGNEKAIRVYVAPNRNMGAGLVQPLENVLGVIMPITPREGRDSTKWDAAMQAATALETAEKLAGEKDT